MEKRLPTRTDVLKLLEKQDDAMHSREMATRLGVDEGDYLGFQRLLDDLSFQGVVASRGERFKLTKPGYSVAGGVKSDEREGILTINPRGFGFVASLGEVGDDVFIGAESIGGAMHGDKVVVRVRSRTSRGVEGEIVRIVDRGTKRVAGVLRRKGKNAWLEPDDNRVRGPITLTEEIDTKGGEGNSGNDGDAVIVAITRYPDVNGETPVGKIEAVLGRPGELKVEVAKILVLEKIEEVHSEQAFQEASSFGQEVPEEMKEGREDLRHLPLPTIDPEDARDHDDAVWVERSGDGGYKAWIAIADVSSYVTPGTKIDEEAKSRGVSVYLPDRAIPMLPRPLSSNLCSLLPDVDRLCLCVEVEADGGGNLTSTRLIRGVMRSQAKLTYGGVARALGFTELPPRQPEADAMKDGLRVAYELSRLLRNKRMKRGALDFDLPEAKIILDETTREPTDIQRRAQDPGMKRGYQLIEELMILANEVVARWMEQKEIATIFRVHGPPDPKKLDRFTTMCEALGIPFDVESTKDPKLLAALLKSFADHPLAAVLNSLLLRSMKQATYDVTNIGHFGLASKSYLHFTSPIRRYPDLVVHRRVHKILLNQKIVKGGAEDVELANAAMASSIAERKSMEVERAVVDLYRAFLMKDKIGETFEGTVTAVVGSGVFVALDAPFVDVLVRLEDLGTEQYNIDDEGLRAVAGRSGDVVSLGDRMEVEIIDVAILRRSVYGKRLNTPADQPLHKRGGGANRDARRGGQAIGAKPSYQKPAQHRGSRGRPVRGAEVRSEPTRDTRETRGASGGKGAPRGGKPNAGKNAAKAVDQRVDRAIRQDKKNAKNPTNKTSRGKPTKGGGAGGGGGRPGGGGGKKGKRR
jgi:ribonuclease R